MVKVMVVDDHALIRPALREVLRQENNPESAVQEFINTSWNKQRSLKPARYGKSIVVDTYA